MSLRLCALAALLAAITLSGRVPVRADIPDVPPAQARLHNGWKVSPAGRLQKFGDMPLGGALSPDKSTLAVTNAGFNQHHLYLLDAQTGAIKQTFPLPCTWNGVAWAKDGKAVYAAGGSQPQVYVFRQQGDGTFAPADPIVLPDLLAKPGAAKDKQALVSGLALSSDDATLYVANFATDTLFALNLADGSVLHQRKLALNAHPYCLRLAPDGKSLYVAQSAFGKIAVLSAADLSDQREIKTEQHPNDILFAPDGRIFVSCGSSNSVLVLDPASGETRERIVMNLTPHAPTGTTPECLALSPDGKTLYVANSDNNDVAVVDVASPGHSRVKGFVPTGWYPTFVFATPDGKSLLIGSGKGMGTGANPQKKFPLDPNHPDPDTYVGTLLYGVLATLPAPDDKQLAAYTRQVVENTPYKDSLLLHPVHAARTKNNPIPDHVGGVSPIKHVLYIIKENRTYDQVLGDMTDASGQPIGNGDPKLTLFGEKITPNIHELARQYVLLDNILCSGEVSGNGHPWSTAAYGTDIGEREWQLDYSSHAPWVLTDKDIYPPIGRIWDVCDRLGVSFASYYYTWTTDNTHLHMPKVWEENLNKLRDFENADLFAADLKQYEANNNLPRFMIMSLREDHTEGTTPGRPTPVANVASNDLGVGKIVDACSHSKYWKEMAIFIIQDDAQDGPDHVDAHRTEALVISPYSRKRGVDSTFYNTTSMLRTMELILGLPPMSQYDAAAAPMYACFGDKPDLTPYTAKPAQVDVMAKNGQTAYGAKESSLMDFSGPDRLTKSQVDALNRILWHSVKGANVPYPGVVHRPLLSTFGSQSPKDADDD